MKSLKVSVLASVAFFFGAVSAARAENLYCSLNDDSNNKNRAFTTPSQWKDSNGTGYDEFSEEHDYYVCCDLYLSLAQNLQLNVGPLHMGCLAMSKAGSASIYAGGVTAPKGFVVEKGSFTANRYGGWAHPIKGDIKVLSPSSAPFVFKYNYGDSSFNFNGAVIGNEDVAFSVNGGTKSNVGCTFADVSRYCGLINATSTLGEESQYNVKLTFKNTYFPGSLNMSQGTEIQMDSSVAGLKMTVSNMTFRTGSRIIIGGTADAHGSFTAAGSLKAESGVEVYLNFAVPVSKDEQRFVLLSAPVENADFTEGDFTLNASKSDWKHHCRLETFVEDGVKSLVAVFEPLVQQTGSYPYEYEFKNTAEYHASSMTNAARWSDGQVPHGGAHYFTKVNVRTPYLSSSTGIFPGKSLALIENTSTTIPEGALRIFYRDYTVTNLIVNRGTVQFANACKALHCERITVIDKTLSFQTYLGNVVEIDSEIVGGGNIWFSGIKRSAGTSSPSGQYVLRKPNPDYMGTVCVSQFINEAGYINFASMFQTLRIADGRCLGGRLPELNPAALTLANYSRLRTIAPTVELEDGFNRGVYIQGCGRFFVDSADGAEKLICNWPITMNGAFYKEGNGRLELGGTVSFQGEDAIGDTPRANSNLFFVSKGTLVPRRYNCCDGMAMSFAKGTKLVVPVVPADADLMKYGLYNVKEGGSISIADTQLAVDFDLSASAQPPAKEFTVGIITVPVASAENIRGRLKLGATTYKGYRRAKLDEVPDETLGTVTFVGRFEQDGLSVIVR